jgi:hypothetical protein
MMVPAIGHLRTSRKMQDLEGRSDQRIYAGSCAFMSKLTTRMRRHKVNRKQSEDGQMVVYEAKFEGDYRYLCCFARRG